MVMVAPPLTNEQKAAAIVSHVLVHFGAGYGAQRQTENPSATPTNAQIFRQPSDLSSFHFMLLESTLRNFSNMNWDTNTPLRAQVTLTAYEHGKLARQKVVADGSSTLSITQILDTLATVKATHCPTPAGAGGGRICDF
jgi:hypothetical protein